MSEPIIFIAHQKIKQGKVEEYKKVYQEVGEWMEANKPQTAAHIAYVREDGTEASVVHIFPDIEAMENHMQNLGGVGAKAFTLMEIAGFDVYGTPSKMVNVLAFPQSEWVKVEAKLGELAFFRKDLRAFQRFLISGVEYCPLDRQGRILVPQNLRDYAKLNRDVALVGAIRCFEIWDKEAFEGHRKQLEASINEEVLHELLV